MVILEAVICGATKFNTNVSLLLFQDKHHDAAHEIIETIR